MLLAGEGVGGVGQRFTAGPPRSPRLAGYACTPSTCGAFSTQTCQKSGVMLELTAADKVFDTINLTGNDLTADDIADFRAVLQAVAGGERSQLLAAVDHAVEGSTLAYVGVDQRGDHLRSRSQSGDRLGSVVAVRRPYWFEHRWTRRAGTSGRRVGLMRIESAGRR